MKRTKPRRHPNCFLRHRSANRRTLIKGIVLFEIFQLEVTATLVVRIGGSQ